MCAVHSNYTPMGFMKHHPKQANSKRVRIFDTTLRDGEQTPGVHFSVEQKIAIARQLEAFGVDTIEAGFPASSPGDAEAVLRVRPHEARRASWRSEGLRAGGRRPLMPLSLRCAK